VEVLEELLAMVPEVDSPALLSVVVAAVLTAAAGAVIFK
jgi:hypothetical protein